MAELGDTAPGLAAGQGSATAEPPELVGKSSSWSAASGMNLPMAQMVAPRLHPCLYPASTSACTPACTLPIPLLIPLPKPLPVPVPALLPSPLPSPCRVIFSSPAQKRAPAVLRVADSCCSQCPVVPRGPAGPTSPH